MPEIIPNVVISNPNQIFTMPREFKSVFNGMIYIGKIDTDPTIAANQIQVYLENEDGSYTPMPQPIRTNAGGYPVYNGKVSKFVTIEGHSMLIQDVNGVQLFYFPNVLKYDPDQFQQRLADADGLRYIGMCDDIIQLRSIEPLSNGQLIILRQHTLGTNLGGGEFRAVLNATTYTDNNGTVVKTPNGNAWVRTNAALNNPVFYGAMCDGVTDDTDVINSIIASANGGMQSITFPYASVVKILGTILVPGGTSINLNHSIVEGNGSSSVAGTNTIFESAYWNSGVLETNWGIPPEQVGITGLVPDLRIYGGRIRFAGTACKMYQMIYGSSITNLRITACPFPMIIKDSFYGTFEGISVLSPPASVKWPIGWQVESNIQAMGIRKCVAAGFNTGWRITGSSATDCFDTCTAEHNVRGVDIYGGPSGTVMNLELHNWYFEYNTIAVRVDGDAICQRLYLRNCYLHWSILHVDATTVLSGGIDKSCNIQDSATYPGGVNMQGRCGEKTFYIELDDSVSSSHTTSTLPGNYSVTGVEVERIETLVNSSNQVIARNLRQTSTPPKNYTGQSLGTTLPNNSVPFCSVNSSNPTRIVIATQVIRSAYNIIHINLLVTDGGTPTNACGTLFGSFNLMQPSDTKAMTITYDSNNRMLIAIAGTNITNVQGIVRVI